ncbi:MAG: hypothetical protein WC880_00140 [Candidatus Paceibacterota bacterium]
MSAKFQWAFFGVIICVGVISAWFFFARIPTTVVPHTSVCTEEAKICPDGSTVGRMGPACEFAQCETPVYNWIVSDSGSKNSSGAPLMNVAVSLNRKEYFVGAYAGACAEIGVPEWPLFEGEKAGIACWFETTGTEIGVFDEQGRLVLKKALLSVGADGSSITRGAFEILKYVGLTAP